jgi:hypothetical protein
MGRSILLNGKHTPLGSQLTRLFLEDGDRLTGLIEGPLSEPLPGEEAEENLTLIPWNRSSPISVHNVIVEAINRTGGIDEAVFLFQTEIENKPLHEQSLAAIDSYIDDYIKGSLYLLKEILGYFQKCRKGALYIVLDYAGMEVLPPIDALGVGGIEAFTNTLFMLYQNEEIRIHGFTSSTAEKPEYAAFIHRSITDKARSSHGKWFRFNERSMWSALGFSSKKR